jgi:hypothetical protein
MEGQGRKTRAALWTTAVALPNEGLYVGQPANVDKRYCKASDGQIATLFFSFAFSFL